MKRFKPRYFPPPQAAASPSALPILPQSCMGIASMQRTVRREGGMMAEGRRFLRGGNSAQLFIIFVASVLLRLTPKIKIKWKLFKK